MSKRNIRKEFTFFKPGCSMKITSLPLMQVKKYAIMAKMAATGVISKEHKEYLSMSEEMERVYPVISKIYWKHGYNKKARRVFAALDKWGIVHV